MKKTIKLIIALILMSTIAFLTYKITSKLNHKKEVAKRTKTIPEFSFKTVSGAEFSRDNLKQHPTIFVYFNSECDFCQSEAEKIQERLTDFKNMQLIFVSYENSQQIQKFAQTYLLNNKKNVIFLEDSQRKFSSLFDVNSLPYIVVYNKKKQLLKKFKGAVKIDDILKVLK